MTNGITRYNERYDEMAMSGAERQRKWIKKNRALHNLRRRNARKKGGDASCAAPAESLPDHAKSIIQSAASDAVPTVQPASTAFGTRKVGEFRMLVIPEEKVEERSTMPATKPLVYRNDYGAVISEDAWRRLQDRKKKAEKEGFEYDEYSQT